MTSVGSVRRRASRAAIRAGLTNHAATASSHAGGEWIPGAHVVLGGAAGGDGTKLRQMAATWPSMNASSRFHIFGKASAAVAVRGGKRSARRLAGLDDLFEDVAERLPMVWHPHPSGVIPSAASVSRSPWTAPGR